MVDADEARTVGRRVRQIRYARGKSLRVVAGLAGMSKSHLQRIERGERALDSLSEIVALANALQISPSELIRVRCLHPSTGIPTARLKRCAGRWQRLTTATRAGGCSPSECCGRR